MFTQQAIHRSAGSVSSRHQAWQVCTLSFNAETLVWAGTVQTDGSNSEALAFWEHSALTSKWHSTLCEPQGQSGVGFQVSSGPITCSDEDAAHKNELALQTIFEAHTGWCVGLPELTCGLLQSLCPGQALCERPATLEEYPKNSTLISAGLSCGMSGPKAALLHWTAAEFRLPTSAFRRILQSSSIQGRETDRTAGTESRV